MKRIFILLTVIFAVLTVTAVADETPLLYDGADLLTYNEEAVLLSHLNDLSNEYGFSVVVVTSENLMGYYDAESAATEYYEDRYNYDGVMLFISMADRDWYVLTSGSCMDSITYDEIDYLSEKFLDKLGDGYYYDAFVTFADNAVWLSTQNYSEDSDSGFSLFGSIIKGLLIGFIVSLVITAIMKGQLKSVKSQVRATQYTKEGSMNVTESRDIFLYRNVSKTLRSSNSGGSSGGSHRSSSGRSYGGRGGKF